MSARIEKDNFPKAFRAADGIFRDALSDTAEIGAGVARSHVPTDAARARAEERQMLLETIRIEGQGGDRVELIAGDAETDFGRFQEFGTTVHEATPFMGPAITVMTPVLKRNGQREVRRRLR